MFLSTRGTRVLVGERWKNSGLRWQAAPRRRRLSSVHRMVAHILLGKRSGALQEKRAAFGKYVPQT